MPNDGFYEAVSRSAAGIEKIPLDWWPECVEKGLGLIRRHLKAKVSVVQDGDGVPVAQIEVKLPHAMGQVTMWVHIHRHNTPELDLNKALYSAIGRFSEALVERILPPGGMLIIWDERKHER